MPTDPTLKPIHRDPTFYVLLAISLPGLLAAFMLAWQGVTTGSFDPEGFYAAVFAAPVVIYLGIGREYARGKSVEATGAILMQTAAVDARLHANALTSPEEMLPASLRLDVPADASDPPAEHEGLHEQIERRDDTAELMPEAGDVLTDGEALLDYTKDGE